MKIMEPATGKLWEKHNCIMLQKLKYDVESDIGNESFQ